MHSATNDQIIQAVFTASPEDKSRALLILQGKEPEPKPAPVEGPLLMSMGEAAKFLNVSRGTLWRMVKEGRLEKVEIYHNAYRLRRSDILALVAGGRDPGSPRRPRSSFPINHHSTTINSKSPEVSRG